MKILGVNISHDASIAVIEDGRVVEFLDEERHRRAKHWTINEAVNDPEHGRVMITWSGYQSIFRAFEQHDDIDAVMICSFDRRKAFSEAVALHPERANLMDWDDYENFFNSFVTKPLSKRHVVEMNRLFPKVFDLPETKTEVGQADEEIIGNLTSTHFSDMDQSMVRFIPSEHHSYHALSAYHFSPWYNEEDVICIAWDGGGAMSYFENYPGFQELESIWRLTPGKNPTRQYTRFGNSRELHDSISSARWPILGYQTAPVTYYVNTNDETVNIDGAECVFTHKSSMGQNFSELCSLLGYEEHGRQAGKVMGAAANGGAWKSFKGSIEKGWGQFTLANQLQDDSLEFSLGVIQKAIDLNPDCKRIVLSGGFSLNCTNNYKYLQHFPDYEFFVDPAANDGGTAIGGALYLENLLKGEQK